MAKQKQTNKKENPLVGGIITLICGIIALALGADYVWVLFGVIEIPLQIAGAIFAVIGVICILMGIKGKKKATENKENAE